VVSLLESSMTPCARLDGRTGGKMNSAAPQSTTRYARFSDLRR